MVVCDVDGDVDVFAQVRDEGDDDFPTHLI